MEDEFDKLMKIFDLEPKEKEKKLEEIFLGCSDFFERYKYILAEGTSEEKDQIQLKMNKLKEKVKEENVRSQENLGISKDEVNELSRDPKNFTPEQWEFLQRAQEKLFSEREEYEKASLEAKQARDQELRLKAKKKGSSRKSKWMKS